MENPLNLPAPIDPVQRIHDFARDIAYGAVNGIWSSKLLIRRSEGKEWWRNWDSKIEYTNNEKIEVFDKFRKEKWNSENPSAELLISFEYVTIREVKGHGSYDCQLTPKAFTHYLEKPFSPPSVFISYKQDQSSALALLIEARLKLQDTNINVFIDKLLQAGDDWEQRLENTVRGSRFFVVLISKETLASATIQKEIKWAYDAGCTIIAICHNSYKIDVDFPTELKGKQAIMIERESAKHYESAISDLLNGMGYSTY